MPIGNTMSEVDEPARNSEWLAIGLRADEPAHIALFKHFLNEGGYAYRESPECIEILKTDVERLNAAVEIWAFASSMPDDERAADSLNSLLREIGHIVTDALGVTASVSGKVAKGIDLR